MVNGERLSEPDKIRQGWADSFKTLATPTGNENFNESYKYQIELRKHLIQNVCENNQIETEVSSCDVQKFKMYVKTIKLKLK